MARGKKWYYVGWMSIKQLELCSTEKAFYLDYDHGYHDSDRLGHLWFPKSQCIFEEANDVGNFKVYIPCWLIDNNPTLDVHRVRFSYSGRVQM